MFPPRHGRGDNRMSDPFIGQLLAVPYNFAPKGWALCNGQVLPIDQYQALFSLLGTTYGGNGTTNFALPDLRGRVPISSGHGPGLSDYFIGQEGGNESVALTSNQLPSHTHAVSASSAQQTLDAPSNAVPAVGGAYAPADSTATMAPKMVEPTGAGQPVTVVQPYLTINWIIALVGSFPVRS